MQLAAAMLLRCRAGLDFWRDWWGTSDAIWSAADPWPALAQPLVLMETAWRAGRRRINLSQALTWDIEWNGLADVAPM